MDGARYAASGERPVPRRDDDFKIKGAASRLAARAASSATPPEDCIICLQPLTERAVAVPCNHLSFDFICLVSWLQQRETCPLCNAVVTVVQFDWRSPSDYKSFEVRPPTSRGRADAPVHQYSNGNGQWCDRTGRSSRARRNHVGGPDSNSPGSPDPAIDRRRAVYQQELYSLHVGANEVSGHHEFAPEEFSNSLQLQRRARIFLRRELQVFSYLDLQSGARNADFVLEYIVAMLKRFDPKAADGRARDLLSEFLDRASATLLLHELLAWLRSPYSTLGEWDRNVQYSHSPGGSSTKDIGGND